MSFYDKDKKVRLRIALDPKERFPEKLYDVANDNFLVKWGPTGESVTVADPETFEAYVMKCYPGFLQIPSFNNFRRLFREYGFDWTLHADDTLEFSHDFFVRNQPQLLEEIVTRRKSFSRPVQPKTPQTSTPLGKRRSSLRRIVLEIKSKNFRHSEDRESPRSLSPVDAPRNVVHEQIPDDLPPSEISTQETKRRKLDPAVLNNFVKNELTEEEIWMLIERQDWTLSRVERPEENCSPKPGTEWMYMFSGINYPYIAPRYEFYNSWNHRIQEWASQSYPTDPRINTEAYDLAQLQPVTRTVNRNCCQCWCHTA